VRETAAERSWVLADSVDLSWLSKASHSDSSSVTFDTIRFCSASGRTRIDTVLRFEALIPMLPAVVAQNASILARVGVFGDELALDGELQDQLAQLGDAVGGFGKGREILNEGVGVHVGPRKEGLTRRRGAAKKEQKKLRSYVGNNFWAFRMTSIEVSERGRELS